MNGSGGWTRADSLNTMTLAQSVPCQGAGHALLAPARPADQGLRCPRPLARPPQRRPRTPPGPRPPAPPASPPPPAPAVWPVGRPPADMALSTLHPVRPLLGPGRLAVAIDDTPTARYGPCVEGCGLHHNPSPGPAGEKYVYGHVWVTLAALARHPDRGTVALPLQAQLYIRKADLAKLPPERPRAFRTKLELAAEQLRWLRPWVDGHFAERWAVADGAYAKRPFLRPAREQGFTVVSRLRK